jgi:hypothetical protein
MAASSPNWQMRGKLNRKSFDCNALASHRLGQSLDYWVQSAARRFDLL